MRTLNYEKLKKFISVILLVSIVLTSNGFVAFSQSINPEQDTVNNDVESPFLVQKTKTAGSYYKQFKENLDNKTSLLYNDSVEEEVEDGIIEENDDVIGLDTKVKPKTSHDNIRTNEAEPEEEPEAEEEDLVGMAAEDETLDTSSDESIELTEEETSFESEESELEDESEESSEEETSSESILPDDETESSDEESKVESSSDDETFDESFVDISSPSAADEEVVESETETSTEAQIKFEPVVDIATPVEIFEPVASSSVIKNKNLQKIYYGDGEEEEEAHVHKICGISTESICRHTLVAPHDDFIQYKATMSTLDDLESMTGGSYFLDRDLEYITAIGDVTYLQIIPVDDIYICLNGFMLKNVVFLASKYTVTITNCKPNVATWINKDPTHSCKSNLDIFGIGNNLVFETSLLYRSTGDAKTINAYSATFKNYYNDIDVSSEAYVNALGLATFETCTMSEAMRAKHMILANSDLITFNCLFDSNTTADALVVKTGTGTWQLLGHNTFEGNTWGTSVASSLVYVNGGAVVLPEDTTAIFNGNKNTYIASSLFKVNAGKLDVKERAMLDISYNDMTKHSDSWSSFLRVIGTNCEFYNYGEIHIRNNRVTNCISSYNSNNISGINTTATIHLIEDSIIQVEDNRAVDNNGRDANYNTYKTFYFYDFYGGVNPMFTRDTDYVFDKASIIGEMAMYTNGTAGGTLMQNYTAETVKDFDYFSYLTDFDICTFDNRTNACPYLDLATNEMKIIVNSHQHKVCGQDKNTACTHTKLAAHSVYKPYNDYNHVKDVTEMTKGWWYLSANLSSTNLKVITMETDVWLCLNGKTLTNYVFRNSEGNNFKVYISSCSASGTMANSTNEYMLTGDEEIYGMDIVTTSKTATYFVNLKANYIYKNKNTTDRSVFYVCNFLNYNQSVTGNTLVDVDGNNNVIFEIIRSDSANGGDKIISLKNVTLTFYSLMFIKTSRITGSYLYLDNAKITFNGPLSFSQCTYSESADLNGLIKLVNASTFTSASISIKVRSVVNGQVVTNTETLHVSYEFKSNTGYYVGSMLSVSNDSSFTLDTSTSFVCESNKIDRSKIRNGVNAFLYLENNTISLKGSISIKSNQITGCNATAAADTGVCSAVYMTSTGVLNIGSGAITINSNTTNGNQTTNPSYHMYQIFSENSNGFIAQSASTKLDINNLHIVVFARNYQNAIIYRNYTNANVNNYSPTSFISHVVADNFNPTDLDVIRDVNSNLVLHTGLHRHKVCGVAEGAACTHTETAAHTAAIAYTEVPAISSTYTLQDFVNTIKGGGVYCLTDDVENNTSAIMQIQVDYPVYICLNGKNLSGFRFNRKDTACVYITNCQTTKSTIYNRFGYWLFLLGAELYGIDDNLLVRADGIEYSYSGQQYGFSAYNVEFEAGLNSLATNTYGMFYMLGGLKLTLEKCSIHSMINARVIRLESNSKSVMKNVEIKNANSLTNIGILVSYQAELLMRSEIKINNNNYTTNPLIQVNGGGVLHVENGCTLTLDGNRGKSHLIYAGSGSSSYAELLFDKGSVANIQNNIIDKQNTKQAFIYATTDTFMFGELNLTDNKLYNCTSSLNSGIAAAYYIDRTNSVVYLKNTKLTIKDNKSYKDEGVTEADDATYQYHHLYQMFTTNTNGMFAQYLVDSNGDGVRNAVAEKWDPRNSYIVVAIVSPNTGIVYKDWSSTSIQNFNENLYQNTFQADTFVAADYAVKLASSRKSVILDFEHDKHMHKICGVASGSDCLHTLTAPHTTAYQYEAASDFQAVAADTVTRISQGGVYYLREDLNLSSLTAMTLRADLDLCLNGHIIKNLYIANTTHTLNITNCIRNVESSITAVTGAGVPFNQSNTHFYGLDKNLKLVSKRVTGQGSNMRAFSAFNTLFESQGADTDLNYALFYNTTTLTLEDCEVRGYKYHSGFNNNTNYINIKNCIFEDMKFDHNLIDSNVSSVRPTVNFYGENYIRDIEVGASVFYDNQGADFIIHDGLTKIQNVYAAGNASITNRGLIAITNQNSDFIIDEDAELYVSNNEIVRVNNDQAAIYSVLQEMSIYGDLNITDNRFIACSQTNASGNIAGLYTTDADAYINVASTSIVTRGNTSDTDDLLYPNHHVYQVLAMNTAGAYRDDPVFKPRDGYKFIATESYINIAFLKEPYTGLVFKNFDEDHVADYHNIDISKVIVADQYNNTLLFAIESGDDVVIRDDAVHSHKICGLSPQYPCAHTIDDGIVDRNATYIYTELSSDPTVAIATLSEGGVYYLSDDISFAELATVSIADNVILCLNGFNIKNVVFLETEWTIYITNCQAGVSKIINETDEYLFMNKVYLYGKKSDYKNIEINSDHIYLGQNSNHKSFMFDLDVKPYNTQMENGDVFVVDAGAELLLQDLYIHGFQHSGNLITNNAYLAFYGINNFYSNNIGGSLIRNAGLTTFKTGLINMYENEVSNALILNEFMFSTEKANINIINNTAVGDSIIKYTESSSVVIASHTDLSITSNNIKKSTSSQTIYDIRTTNHKFLGDLVIKDNRFINCNSVTADGIISAIYIREGIDLLIGDTVITIDNNTSDATDKLATSSYAFQIYSMNPDGFFRQEPGTKFHALSSLMTVGFGRPGHTGTIYKDFTAENVYEIDKVAYYTTFLSDKFFDQTEGLILNVKMSEDKKDVIIRQPDKNLDHYHKLCGVYTDEDCLHTENEAHTQGYVYEELSSTLEDDKYQEIFAAGGYYYLTDNTAMTTDLEITVENDLYICLSGFNLSYLYFKTTKANVNLYITNCKTNVSTITNKAKGPVSGTSNADIRLFFGLPNVEVYGKSKNLKIVSNYMYKGSQTYVSDAYFYSVLMNSYDTTKSYNTGTSESNGETSDNYYSRFAIWNSDFTFEEVTIDKLYGGTHAIFSGNSSIKKGDLKIKNCNFTNWDSFGYVPFFFQTNSANIYFIGDNYINNLTNIAAKNPSGSRRSTGGAGYSSGHTLMLSWVPIVVKGGVTEFNNIKTSRRGRYFIHMHTATFTVEEDATFYMHNVSQLKGHISQSSAFFYTEGNIYAYGSFKITEVAFPASGGGLKYGGKPVSAGTGGGMTLCLGSSSSKMYIGNNVIDIGLSAYAKNSNFRASADRGVYGVLSSNVNSPIVQLPNTKLNLNSKIPLVFNSGNPSEPSATKAGTLYSTFDEAHVQSYKENAWIKIFQPYTRYFSTGATNYYYSNTSNYLLKKGKKVIFEAKVQSHYLCGGSSAHSGHREIPTSFDSSKISYTGLDPTLTTEDVIRTISGGGNIHLSAPLGDNDVRAVQIKSTLNLCLNGFDVNNITFSGTGAINICNCQTDLNSNIRLSNLQTPLFRNEEQTAIFSANGNLDVYTNRFIEKSAGNLYLYGVNPHAYTKNYDDADFSYIYLPNIEERHTIILEKVHFASFSSLGRIMEFGNDAKTKPTTTIKFSEVQIEDVKDYKYNIFKSSELISFTGECYIKNCQKYRYEDSSVISDYPLLGISGEVAINAGGALKVMDSRIGTSDVVNMSSIRRLSVAVGGEFTITNNTITRSNRSITSIIRIGGNKNYVLGRMTISNNYFTGCTEYNNVGTIAALYIENGGLITLGNEFINITKNTSNMTATIATMNEVTGEFNYDAPEGVIDERTYQNHHVFDIFSNNRSGIFTQYKDIATGEQTKFNPQSTMKIAFADPYIGIMFKDWLPETVDYQKVTEEWDEELYKSVFKADGFGQDLRTGNKRVRRALRILMSENMRDVLLDTEHLHMICGAPTFASCSHIQKYSDEIHKDTLIFEQVNYFASDKVAKSLSLEGEPGPAGRSLLRDIGTEDGIGYVYLHQNLYLCLNGYTMTNVVFKSADNNPKIVYVTNCRHEKRGGIRSLFESQMFDESISLYFWGNNKNIRLAANEIFHLTEDVDTWFTDVVFANDKVFGTDKDAIIIDNIDITFYNCALDGMQSSRDAIRVTNGGSATFETFYASGSFIGRSLINVENGELTINGGEGDLNICTVSNATFSNTSRGSLFSTGKDGKINFNCEVLITEPYSYLSDHMVHNEGTMLMTDPNNSFTIIDGQMNKTVASQSFLYFAGEQTFYGDLVLRNCKYINCITDTPGTILTGMHMGSETAVLKVAEGEYFVNAIKAYTDDGEVLVDDETNRSMHVYQVYSENRDFFLEQKEGTKFDAVRASMSIAFKNPGIGKVIDNWTKDTVKDFFDMRFKDAFSADQFDDSELYCQLDDEGTYVMIGYRHYHKVCGELENCTHIGIASHSEALYFDKLTQLDMDDIAHVITKGRFRYLIQDIDARYLSSLTDITLDETLYLCLNGHNITNMRFMPSNFKLYIMNCSHKNSEITVSNGAFVRNIDTEIYGKATRSAIEGESKDTVSGDRNIKIIAPMVAQFDRTVAKNFYAGNVEYEHYGSRTGDAVFMMTNAAHTATIENLAVFKQTVTGTVTDFIKVDNAQAEFNIYKLAALSYTSYKERFINLSRGKMTIHGDNYFANCVNSGSITSLTPMTKREFIYQASGELTLATGSIAIIGCKTDAADIFKNAAGSFTTAEDTNLIIKDCIVKSAANTSLKFLNLSGRNAIYGNVEVSYNKFVSATGQARHDENYNMSGIGIGADTVFAIGHGVIIATANEVYRDSEGTPGQENTNLHVFQVLAFNKNGGPIFKQLENTKFNTLNRLSIAFIKAYYTGTVIEDWNRHTMDHYKPLMYEIAFIPDTWFNRDLISTLSKDGQDVIIGYIHEHKVCGIDENGKCTHTLQAAHEGTVGYKALPPSLTSEEIIELLTVGGKYYLHKLDPSTETRVVTPKRDLYICLNGNALPNIRFTETPYSIYITNCVVDVEKAIAEREHDMDLNGSYITNESDEYMFNNNLYVYGQELVSGTTKKGKFNINLKSNLINNSGNGRGQYLYLYNTDVYGFSAAVDTHDRDMFSNNESGKWIFEDVNITEVNNVHNIYTSSKNASNVFDIVNIKNNNITGTVVDISEKSNYRFEDVTLTYNKTEHNLVSVAGSPDDEINNLIMQYNDVDNDLFYAERGTISFIPDIDIIHNTAKNRLIANVKGQLKFDGVFNLNNNKSDGDMIYLEDGYLIFNKDINIDNNYSKANLFNQYASVIDFNSKTQIVDNVADQNIFVSEDSSYDFNTNVDILRNRATMSIADIYMGGITFAKDAYICDNIAKDLMIAVDAAFVTNDEFNITDNVIDGDLFNFDIVAYFSYNSLNISNNTVSKNIFNINDTMFSIDGTNYIRNNIASESIITVTDSSFIHYGILNIQDNVADENIFYADNTDVDINTAFSMLNNKSENYIFYVGGTTFNMAANTNINNNTGAKIFELADNETLMSGTLNVNSNNATDQLIKVIGIVATISCPVTSNYNTVTNGGMMANIDSDILFTGLFTISENDATGILFDNISSNVTFNQSIVTHRNIIGDKLINIYDSNFVTNNVFNINNNTVEGRLVHIVDSTAEINSNANFTSNIINETAFDIDNSELTITSPTFSVNSNEANGRLFLIDNNSIVYIYANTSYLNNNKLASSIVEINGASEVGFKNHSNITGNSSSDSAIKVLDGKVELAEYTNINTNTAAAHILYIANDDFDFATNINMNHNTFATASEAEMIYVAKNLSFTGDTININDNINGEYANQGFIYMGGDNFTINVKNLNINANKIYRNRYNIQKFINIENEDAEMHLLGESAISISDNKVEARTASNSEILAMFYIGANQKIETENISIKLKNNGSTGVASDNNHLFGIYSLNSDGFIEQVPNTRFDATNNKSAIENIAFNTADGTGIIYKHWNADNVNGYAKLIHRTVFVADNVYNSELYTKRENDNAVIAWFERYVIKYKPGEGTDEEGVTHIGTGSVADTDGIIEFDSRITGQSFYAEGCDFAGWGLATNSGAVFLPNGLYNLDDYVENGEVILYGQYTPKKSVYTVTFYSNNKDAKNREGKTVVSIQVLADDPFEVYTNYDLDGYYLEAYNTRPDGTGLDYQINTPYYNKTATDIVLYAMWARHVRPTGGGGGTGGGSMKETVTGLYVTGELLPINSILPTYLVNSDTVYGSWDYDPQTGKWRYITDRSLFEKNRVYLDNLMGFDSSIEAMNLGVLKGGMYRLGIEKYYYYFDRYGNMMTGFFNFYGNEYYAEEAGIYKGAIVRGNKFIDGIEYQFTQYGELIPPEDGIYTVTQGAWYYDVMTNTWGYAVKGANNKYKYLRKGLYRIRDQYGVYKLYYVDEDGNFVTGKVFHANKFWTV